MFSDAPVCAVLQAKDLDRVKAFYTDKVGLKLKNASSDDGVMFECGKGTAIMFYKPGRETTPTHTVAGFNVENLEEAMTELKGRGVEFEDYDFPGLKTVNGVATFGPVKSAWFTDSEGNILAINQM